MQNMPIPATHTDQITHQPTRHRQHQHVEPHQQVRSNQRSSASRQSLQQSPQSSAQRAYHQQQQRQLPQDYPSQPHDIQPQQQQLPQPQFQPQSQPQSQQQQVFMDNSGFEEVATSARSQLATISIALPSSILNNAQSPELRMYLAGQVARAAAIYCVDEIIVFDEQPDNDEKAIGVTQPSSRQRSSDIKGLPNATQFFATVLEYLETPQYLRKHLFPVSSELRLVGLLNPLALPSHVARTDTTRWRDGVVLTRQQRPNKRLPQDNASQLNAHTAPPSRFVDIGLDRLVEVDRPVPAGTRVTVDMALSGPNYEKAHGKYLFGRIVPWDTPRKVDQKYWGYRVRTASSLSDVFSGSEIASRGYDLTIGTSEHGTHISLSGRPSQSFALPEFSNLLIVFGGVHGLERSVFGDQKLEELGISSQTPNSASNIGDLFDFYLNTCPQQGSRTIRTEEAILISLAALQPFLNTTES